MPTIAQIKKRLLFCRAIRHKTNRRKHEKSYHLSKLLSLQGSNHQCLFHFWEHQSSRYLGFFFEHLEFDESAEDMATSLLVDLYYSQLKSL